MTTEEAFLTAIRETPDDDAPRLIFADWLEDNGDPERAEFIRLLVQAAASRAGEALPLRERAGQLLVANWLRWVGPLRDAFGPNPFEPWLSGMPAVRAVENFRRGFVEKLTVGAPQFLGRDRPLYGLTALTGLSFHGAGGVVDQLATRHELQWIRRLAFVDYYSSPLGPHDAAALASSPHLLRLRQLHLFKNNLGDEGVRALAQAFWLAKLEALDLTENGLSSLGVRALVELARFRKLRHLSLDANDIDDNGVCALLPAPWLPRLETLALNGTGITGLGISLLREDAPSVRIYHDVPQSALFTP